MNQIPKFCARCGASLNDGYVLSMLNMDYICMDCKDAERQSRMYKKAHDAENEAVKKGNVNYQGLYYNVKPSITEESMNYKNYVQRIKKTKNAILYRFKNYILFDKFLRQEYGMTLNEFKKYAEINSDKFQKVCMRLAGETVGQKTTACHSYAGSVSAILTLLGIPHGTFVGLALKRNAKRYRIDKVEAICSGRVACNHCWVYCSLNDTTYDYYNGYNQNIDYIVAKGVV